MRSFSSDGIQKFGNRSQVLRHHFPEVTKEAQDSFAEAHLRSFIVRREAGGLAVGGTKEGAVEADDMIDAIEAEELSGARRASAKPGEIRALERHPIVDGHSPILARRR